MKNTIFILTLFMATGALAAQKIGSVLAIDSSGQSYTARVSVAAMGQKNSSAVSIRNPFIKLSDFQKAIRIQATGVSASVFCERFFPTTPYAVTGQVADLNMNPFDSFDSEQMASLSLKNGVVVATLIPLKEGAVYGVQDYLSCLSVRMDRSGE